MARRQNARFSIYDAMEARGVFDENTANTSSPDYKRREYPRMFYEPNGKERIVVPAEMLETPIGVKLINEQRALISAIAANATEEAALRAAGWHDHPSKANAKAGRAVAPQGASDRIAELEAEIRRLTAAKNSESAHLLASDRAANTAVAGGPLSAAAALGTDTEAEGEEAA